VRVRRPTLTATERRLVDAVTAGERLDLVAADEEISPAAMAGWGPDRTVRGTVIRHILLGGVDQPDPRGISLRGAHIAGGLDLAEVESRLPLRLIDCHTTETIRLAGARLSTVDLSGLVGTNVVAHEVTIERSLLISGARLACDSAEGTVNLGGAHIGAWLDATGSHLTNTHPTGPVVHANNLHTGGGIFLNRGFVAEGGGPLGAVRLSAAVIDSQVNLVAARIVNPDGPALVGDYLSTRSNVMLCYGFHATGRHPRGTIRLVGATIGGRVTFEDGHADGDLALNLSRTHVAGDVLLPTTGLLALTGLTYGGLARESTLTEWLDLLANRTPDYAGQPYHQLAAAHKAAGHERDVRRVHVARQRDLLRRGDLDFWGRLWQRITGLTVGYGYRPTIALLWWAGALLLSALLIAGVAGPAGLAVHAPGRPCSLVDQLGLALNTATPLVKPDSRQNCQIDAASGLGQAVIVGGWVSQALAWAFVTLFVAGFTGLVRRD
jgi:hypothetical protein